MAFRVGGTTGGQAGFAATWASMRSPLVLNAQAWNASYTKYSRQWPESEANPPKFFKWDNGYLFRRAPGGPPPYFSINNNDGPEPGTVNTYWEVGIFFSQKTVDNKDFQPLVGESLDTDIGTFIITADAHNPNQGGQTLSDQPPGGTEIYDIGKLTGF
jgi:hypothetical protein